MTPIRFPLTFLLFHLFYCKCFIKLYISFKSPLVYLMYTTRSYICSCILPHLLFIKFHNFSRSSIPKETVLCSYIHACVVMLIYDLNTCYFWKHTLIYWARFGILYHSHKFHHIIINNPSSLMNSMFLCHHWT